MTTQDALRRIAARFPHPLVFASVSGAHLYGFPSPDSDVDLRGCHVLPLRAVVGLRDPDETEEQLGPGYGLDLDLVSHDVRKFCRLLLKPNGYVLEQLLSPLVVVTSAAHDEMKALVPQLVTRHHAHHYLGFARNQWRMFENEPKLKTLLYCYRVLLTGIHLMRTGEVQANLAELLTMDLHPGVLELLQAKRSGTERQSLPEGAWLAQHRSAITALMEQLERAHAESDLPERPSAFDALDDLVARLRTRGVE